MAPQEPAACQLAYQALLHGVLLYMLSQALLNFVLACVEGSSLLLSSEWLASRWPQSAEWIVYLVCLMSDSQTVTSALSVAGGVLAVGWAIYRVRSRK